MQMFVKDVSISKKLLEKQHKLIKKLHVNKITHLPEHIEF
jgi:hypothetical protein